MTDAGDTFEMFSEFTRRMAHGDTKPLCNTFASEFPVHIAPRVLPEAMSSGVNGEAR
jgi:hypothetical protein